MFTISESGTKLGELMRSFYALAALILLISCSCPGPDSGTAWLESELNDLSSIKDDSLRSLKADQLWESLRSENQIPYTSDSSVVFLYRGSANSVQWHGDFNSWGEFKAYKNKGTQVAGTNIWMLKTTFPPDARLDYKIAVDDKDWILDPANPYHQWSGFGPNSELRMPDYSPEPLKKRIPDAAQGTISTVKSINSKELGYSVNYQVYTPSGYENMSDLSVIYVTDGPEYSDDSLGTMVIMLDNLIHLKKMEPVIAVFVSPIDPGDEGSNRRTDEMGLDPQYLGFFVKELIPKIDTDFKTNPTANARAILGTSLGGLNSTYFAFTKPDVFGMAAIQAPAFWYKEAIYNMVREFDGTPPKIFMSTGTIGDNTPDTRLMKQVFDKKGYKIKYLEVNEGHSWGAWSAQLDDILIYFFGV